MKRIFKITKELNSKKKEETQNDAYSKHLINSLEEIDTLLDAFFNPNNSSSTINKMKNNGTS